MGFTIMESFMDSHQGDAPPRGEGTTVTMRKRIVPAEWQAMSAART